MHTDNIHHFIKRKFEKLCFLFFLLALVSCNNKNLNKNTEIKEDICNTLDLSFSILHSRTDKNYVSYYYHLKESNSFLQVEKNVLRESCIKSHTKVETYLDSLDYFIKNSSVKENINDSVKLFSLTNHFYRGIGALYHSYRKDNLFINGIKKHSLNNDTIIRNIQPEFYEIYLRKLKLNAVIVYMIYQDLTHKKFIE
jgi:hypothetical protein